MGVSTPPRISTIGAVYAVAMKRKVLQRVCINIGESVADWVKGCWIDRSQLFMQEGQDMLFFQIYVVEETSWAEYMLH